MKPLSESGLRPRLDEFAKSTKIRNFVAEVGCDDNGLFLFLSEHECACEALRFYTQGGIGSFKDEQIKEVGKLFKGYSILEDGAEKEIAAMNLCLKIVSFMGPAKLEDQAEVWLRVHDPKYIDKNWNL